MAVDMFLKIDGIDGDATAHKHKGEIELLSFSWGISNSSTSTGGGGGAGKVNVQDLSILKQIGAASPELMEACCSGKHFPSATITLASRETQLEYLKIKLSDVLISSYQTGGSGNTVPVDSVSLNFASVDISAANRKGQFVSQVSCDFHKFSTSGALQNNHE